MQANGEGRRAAAAFTLIELLVVVSIIAVLAAVIFPVFAQARGKARQTACLSNLKQIGGAVQMYAQDYDGLFPYAKDASDGHVPQIWAAAPQRCRDKIDAMPYLHPTPAPAATPGVLDPYVKSGDVWRCPADTGFDVLDNNDSCGGPCPMDSRPTMFEKYGASYLYRTEVAFRQLDIDNVPAYGKKSGREMGPAGIIYLFDGNGSWHGSPFRIGRSGLRYNSLFADGHAKLLTEYDYQDAWQSTLGAPGSDPCP